MKKKKKKIETVRLITFDQVVIDVVGGTVSTRREILENFIVANNEMMTVVGGNSLSRLDQNGKVIVDSVYNGFDDMVKQQIRDYLHPPVQEQTGNSRPKLDNWQKYMENGEYLRSAEITEEANYNMIDGLKNNAAPKEKKNRPKESILAKLNEKKEEVARRSGQKAMQQVMGQDMERTKK